MTTMAEQVMRRFYRHAGGAPERLPWHREAPSSVLDSAVRRGIGTAWPLMWGVAPGCSLSGWRSREWT